MDQNTAQVGVKIHQQIVHRSEITIFRAGERRVADLFQDDVVDGALAKVFSYLGRRVIGPESFLVDVFFEDVTENVGIDLIVIRAGRVVEVP